MVMGFVTGIISAFGIGGGTLLLIWLTVFQGRAPSVAAEINLLYFLPCASFALYSHFKNGMVEIAVLKPAIIAGCISAPLAIFLSTAIDSTLLRKIFGVFLLIIAIHEMLRKEKKA